MQTAKERWVHWLSFVQDEPTPQIRDGVIGAVIFLFMMNAFSGSFFGFDRQLAARSVIVWFILIFQWVVTQRVWRSLERTQGEKRKARKRIVTLLYVAASGCFVLLFGMCFLIVGLKSALLVLPDPYSQRFLLVNLVIVGTMLVLVSVYTPYLTRKLFISNRNPLAISESLRLRNFWTAMAIQAGLVLLTISVSIVFIGLWVPLGIWGLYALFAYLAYLCLPMGAIYLSQVVLMAWSDMFHPEQKSMTLYQGKMDWDQYTDNHAHPADLTVVEFVAYERLDGDWDVYVVEPKGSCPELDGSRVDENHIFIRRARSEELDQVVAEVEKKLGDGYQRVPFYRETGSRKTIQQIRDHLREQGAYGISIHKDARKEWVIIIRKKDFPLASEIITSNTGSQ